MRSFGLVTLRECARRSRASSRTPGPRRRPRPGPCRTGWTQRRGGATEVRLPAQCRFTAMPGTWVMPEATAAYLREIATAVHRLGEDDVVEAVGWQAGAAHRLLQDPTSRAPHREVSLRVPLRAVPMGVRTALTTSASGTGPPRHLVGGPPRQWGDLDGSLDEISMNVNTSKSSTTADRRNRSGPMRAAGAARAAGCVVTTTRSRSSTLAVPEGERRGYGVGSPRPGCRRPAGPHDERGRGAARQRVPVHGQPHPQRSGRSLLGGDRGAGRGGGGAAGLRAVGRRARPGDRAQRLRGAGAAQHDADQRAGHRGSPSRRTSRRSA